MIDLHNNTGHNPPYGISTTLDAIHLGLTGWFANRFVRSDMALGALVEVTDHGAPSVTIECGRAGDPDADDVALRGVDAFLASDALLPAEPPHVDVFEQPIRITVPPGTTLAIADTRQPHAALTITSDVDRHNWCEMEPGTMIGWATDGERLPLEAWRPSGEEVAAELFFLDGGVLRARKSLIPIMMTTDATIAADDCLFYVVRRAIGPP